MTTKWNSTDLEAIAAAEEVDVAPARPDGTLLHPTTIWVVEVGGDLYVRSYRGPAGRWFRAAVRSHRGRVRAGQLEREVTFAEARDADERAVDAAYRAKYGRSSYVGAMVDAATAETTLRLVPHSAAAR